MSKNVFLDLGFARDDAVELALRAELGIRIELLIEERGLTQRDAARLFGVPQPTISKIVNGRLSNLSLAFLLRMLIRADLPFCLRKGKGAEAVEVSIDESDDEAATLYREVRVGAVAAGGVGTASHIIDASSADVVEFPLLTRN